MVDLEAVHEVRTPMSDIDAAIAAASRPRPPELRLVTLGTTGRQFGLPPNLSVVEALDIIAFLASGTLQGMAQEQAKGPVLLTPQGPHRVGMT